MYNKFAIFDDCAVYIDEEKGFVKIVKYDKDLENESNTINKGLIAANIDNRVQSLEKEIKTKKEKMNILNKKRILKEIKNLESHLNFYKERFKVEEEKLETDYVYLQDISRISNAIKEEKEENAEKVKKLK